MSGNPSIQDMGVATPTEEVIAYFKQQFAMIGINNETFRFGKYYYKNTKYIDEECAVVVKQDLIFDNCEGLELCLMAFEWNDGTPTHAGRDVDIYR